MAKLTAKQVKHVAKLARIELTSEEIEKFRSELAKILDYLDQIGEVDTQGIEPLWQPTGLKSIFRIDEDRKFEHVDKLLDSAPDKEGKEIRVKSVK